MIRSMTILLGLTLLAVLPAQVLAGEARTHDGFFLRLSAGGGTAKTSLTDQGIKYELSGGAGDINLAVGGVVASNLAIHGTFFGWATSDPTAKVTGAGSGELPGSLGLSAFGAGVTYYLMPVNIYFSGSVGFAALDLEIDGLGTFESDTGTALDLTVGKEWWVSGSWGLGVALAFGYHSVPAQDVPENLSGTSFAIRFSATMN